MRHSLHVGAEASEFGFDSMCPELQDAVEFRIRMPTPFLAQRQTVAARVAFSDTPTSDMAANRAWGFDNDTRSGLAFSMPLKARDDCWQEVRCKG